MSGGFKELRAKFILPELKTLSMKEDTANKS